jgi:metal-dependent amidase/aminoacylase/carboxypeptidase family protein
MIQGGNAFNVIPDHAIIRADVRAFTPQEFDDYADLSSIAPRVYLLARMLMDLGRNPSMQGH